MLDTHCSVMLMFDVLLATVTTDMKKINTFIGVKPVNTVFFYSHLSNFHCLVVLEGSITLFFHVYYFDRRKK